MVKILWIAGGDGRTLCADGRPIRIVRTGGDPPFWLEADGYYRRLSYWDLGAAKSAAERMASEMDEFMPDVAK